jgi:hypothetical protein
MRRWGRRWLGPVLSALVLLLGLVAAAAALVPPGADPDADDAAFSAARAFVLVERVAVEPHPIGTAADHRVRTEIADQLRSLGLEPQFQPLEVPDYYGSSGGTVTVVNLMARIPGEASTGAVALVGHYDTVPASPGANDNGAAVASILEAARAILAGPPLRNDVVLLFTDAEEPAPRYGSTAFVAEHPWARDIAFVVNLEAVGGGGPSLLLETNGPARWVVDRYAEAVPYPAAFSFLPATSALIGGSNTDFAPFRDRGVPGLEVAYLHGSPIYHTLRDVPENVSTGTLQQHGANTLALARHLGGVDLRAVSDDDEDVVFFTVAGLGVVRYPPAISLVAVVLAGGILATGLRRRRAWRRLLPGLAASAGTALAATVLATVVWTQVAGARSDMGVAESYLYLAGLLLLTAWTGVMAGRIAARRRGGASDPAGVVTLWWVLAAFTAATIPGIGYLFVWPALAAALARPRAGGGSPPAPRAGGHGRPRAARPGDRYLLPARPAPARQPRLADPARRRGAGPSRGPARRADPPVRRARREPSPGGRRPRPLIACTVGGCSPGSVSDRATDSVARCRPTSGPSGRATPAAARSTSCSVREPAAPW